MGDVRDRAKQSHGDSPAAQVLKLPKFGLITYIRGPYNDSGPSTREEEEDKMRSRQKKKTITDEDQLLAEKG